MKPSKASELAKSDLGEVREQVRTIQTCRSTIFVSTIGALALIATSVASTVALGAASKRSNPQSWEQIVTFGAAISMSLLVFGMMSTVEKARAINVRKGFCSALERMLAADRVPSTYQGWANLEQCRRECRAVQKSGKCVELHQATPDKKTLRHHPRCWDVLKQAEYSEYLANKRLRAGITSSFMALSTYFYAIAYAAIVIAGIIVAIVYLNQAAGISPAIVIAWCGAGFLVGGIPHGIAMVVDRSSKRDGVARAIRFADWFWFAIFILLLAWFLKLKVVSLLIAASPVGAIAHVYIYAALLIGTAATTALAFHMFAQLVSLRKGDHSEENYRAIWMGMIGRCRAFEDALLHSPPKTARSIARTPRPSNSD